MCHFSNKYSLTYDSTQDFLTFLAFLLWIREGEWWGILFWGGGGSGAKLRSKLVCGCEVFEETRVDTLEVMKNDNINNISSCVQFDLE